jgi:hypothetical protein
MADEPDRWLSSPTPATAKQMDFLRGLLGEVAASHVAQSGEDWREVLLDFQETVLAVAAKSKRVACTLIDVALRTQGRPRALDSLCTAAGLRFDTILYKHFPTKRPPLRGVPGQLVPASHRQAETIGRFIHGSATASLRKYVDSYEQDDWDQVRLLREGVGALAYRMTAEAAADSVLTGNWFGVMTKGNLSYLGSPVEIDGPAGFFTFVATLYCLRSWEEVHSLVVSCARDAEKLHIPVAIVGDRVTAWKSVNKVREKIDGVLQQIRPRSLILLPDGLMSTAQRITIEPWVEERADDDTDIAAMASVGRADDDARILAMPSMPVTIEAMGGFRCGDRVVHSDLGLGLIVQMSRRGSGVRVKVTFPGKGLRTLDSIDGLEHAQDADR